MNHNAVFSLLVLLCVFVFSIGIYLCYHYNISINDVRFVKSSIESFDNKSDTILLYEFIQNKELTPIINNLITDETPKLLMTGSQLESKYLNLKGIRLDGVRCHRLGLDINDAYTIVIIVQPGVTASNGTLFKMFGHRNDLEINIGLTIDIENGNLKCRHSQVEIDHELNLIDTHRYAIVFTIKPDIPGQLMIIDFDADTVIDAVKNISLPESQNLSTDRFTNIPFTINSTQTLEYHLIGLGIYQSWFDRNDAVKLYDYYHDLFFRLQPHQQEIMKLKSDIQECNSCPYDSYTCRVCGDDIKWGHVGTIDPNMNEECPKAINSFCEQNTGHKMCRCWDTAHPGYNGICKDYRASFAPTINIPTPIIEPSPSPPSSPPSSLPPSFPSPPDQYKHSHKHVHKKKQCRQCGHRHSGKQRCKPCHYCGHVHHHNNKCIACVKCHKVHHPRDECSIKKWLSWLW